MALLVLLTTTISLAFIILIIIPTITRYNQARKLGLPILFTPIDTLNPIFQLFGYPLTKFFKALPFGIGNFVDHSSFANFVYTRNKLHAKYGPAFSVITPKELVVHIADAAAADDILSRRKDFIKPRPMYQPLEIFGPNVDTLNGEGWQRHRRLTTPPFNERNSAHVWKESLKQSRDMLASWLRKSNEGVVSCHDTLTLALHVLTSAGFGKSYDFEGGLTALPDGHTMSYRDALRTVLNHVFLTIIITSLALPSRILPKKLGGVKLAIVEFQNYMKEMVAEERLSMDRADSEKDNLMSVLVRASESEHQGRNGLSNEEIFGNLFIYNLAGHDTTANTLAYAVSLMSTDQKWQEWIREELNEVFSKEDDIEEWVYENSFPRLKRCMALMNETLRLYGPIVVTPKYTSDTPSILDIRGKTYTLPADTYVPINVAALHTSPEYWGDDAVVWRPDRWFTSSSSSSSPSSSGRSTPLSSSSSSHTLSTSTSPKSDLLQPVPGSFIPWASGPRVCPGKKFSQVEFVAVIARLFKNHRVSVKLKPGETEEEGRKRVWECVEDSVLNITVEMRKPERVRFVWEKL